MSEPTGWHRGKRRAGPGLQPVTMQTLPSTGVAARLQVGVPAA